MSDRERDKKLIPTSVMLWKRLATTWDALGAVDSLGSPEKINSASRFEFKHFLGLRVIYKIENRASLPVAISKQFLEDRSPRLEKLFGWNAYLDAIEKASGRNEVYEIMSQTCVPKGLGAFLTVWQLHREILWADRTSVATDKISEVTPIAHRTRAADRNPLQTPTRAPISQLTSFSRGIANINISEGDESGDDFSFNAAEDSLDAVEEYRDPQEERDESSSGPMSEDIENEETDYGK